MGVPAEIKMNGCKYTFTGTNILTFHIDIVGCTVGKSIEIVTPICTITIAEQNNLAHGVVQNMNPGAGLPDETSTKFIEVFLELGNKFPYTEDGGACPNPGAQQEGIINSRANFKAFKVKEQKQVTRQGHQYTEYVCGAQDGIFMT